jgi:sucrose-6-phosphate hydrolase SacC (GH32 family)
VRTFKLLILILFSYHFLTAQQGRELYRPAFHYSPARNWMNDPNGLVFYNNKYHLFYQYNPNNIQPGNTSWGHAVSTDLVTWEEKPIAIPVQNGVMAYSGSVVVDWNNTSGLGINGNPPLIAIYTGASNVQDQRIAYSNDEGTTWTNYSGNPVINSNSNNFRDPKVFWHQQSQKWIMAIAIPAYQMIQFFSSPNLLQIFPHYGSALIFFHYPLTIILHK